MKAPCSIWLSPEGTPAHLRRVLVHTDFSPRSAEATLLAAALAESFGLDDAHSLHVYFNASSVDCEDGDEFVTSELDLAFNRFIAPIDLHGVHFKPLFMEGSVVAHTVLRIAEELGCDLIVMGTRGRSRSAAVLLGSETEHAIRETRIPLLAVKRFGSSLRFLQALLDRRMRSRGSDHYS